MLACGVPHIRSCIVGEVIRFISDRSSSLVATTAGGSNRRSEKSA